MIDSQGNENKASAQVDGSEASPAEAAPDIEENEAATRGNNQGGYPTRDRDPKATAILPRVESIAWKIGDVYATASGHTAKLIKIEGVHLPFMFEWLSGPWQTCKLWAHGDGRADGDDRNFDLVRRIDSAPRAPAIDSSLPADLDSALVAIRGYFMESELGDRPYADLNLLLNALLDSRAQVTSLVSTIAAARGALQAIGLESREKAFSAMDPRHAHSLALLFGALESPALVKLVDGSQALVGGGGEMSAGKTGRMAAEYLLNDLQLALANHREGNIPYSAVVVEREKVIAAIMAAPSPHSEDFPDMRDQMAIAALPAIIEANKENMKISFEGEAEQAYKYADAMIKARKATGASTPEGAQP